MYEDLGWTAFRDCQEAQDKARRKARRISVKSFKEPIAYGAPYMTTWGGQPSGLKKPSVPKIGNVFWAAVGFSRPHGWSPLVFIRAPPDRIHQTSFGRGVLRFSRHKTSWSSLERQGGQAYVVKPREAFERHDIKVWSS